MGKKGKKTSEMVRSSRMPTGTMERTEKEGGWDAGELLYGSCGKFMPFHSGGPLPSPGTEGGERASKRFQRLSGKEKGKENKRD